MVEAAGGTSKKSLKEWGFHEEPPPPAKAGRAEKKAQRSWEDASLPQSPSIGLLVTQPRGTVTFTPAGRSTAVGVPAGATPKPQAPSATCSTAARTNEIIGSNRTFSDIKDLTVEIFRLKGEAKSPAHDEATRAAIRQQIVMRQSEWVEKARTQGLKEPASPIDPLSASPQEVASAFMWSEAGGVIPRAEIARDGGASYRAAVRDAVTLRTRGFDAMLDLHKESPAEQKAILTRSLKDLKVEIPDPATVDELRALRTTTLRTRSAEALEREQEEARKQLQIGLDGFVGTAEQQEIYERDQKLEAMNPGTTLGSIFATYLGDNDIERMRSLGKAGESIEGMGGGAGVHLSSISNKDIGKPVHANDFNRTTRRPKFVTTKMLDRYKGENRLDVNPWRWERRDISTGKVLPGEAVATTQYITNAKDRAQFKLEAREVDINGKTEIRLFDADGKLFDTKDAQNFQGDKRAIFVMNAQGEIYASNFQERFMIHHSTLSGGAEVAAAGELIVEQGKIVAITNRSGHYKPPEILTQQFIQSLRDRGINLGGVVVYDEGSKKVTVLSQ